MGWVGMTPETLSLWLGAAGMFVGLVLVGVLLSAEDADSARGKFAWLAIIPGVATVAYASMALGVGDIVVGGVSVPVPRYVDWLLTTPVLVGYAAYVAGASKRAIAATVAADVAMIVIGWGGVVTTGTARAAAFGFSSLCYVGLLVALYAVFPKTAREQSENRRRLFAVLQNHVGLLWIAYPVMWAAGPLGFGFVTAGAVTLLVTFADVAAKTPYVFFVYAHRRAFPVEGSDRAAGTASVAESTESVTPGD